MSLWLTQLSSRVWGKMAWIWPFRTLTLASTSSFMIKLWAKGRAKAITSTSDFTAKLLPHARQCQGKLVKQDRYPISQLIFKILLSSPLSLFRLRSAPLDTLLDQTSPYNPPRFFMLKEYPLSWIFVFLSSFSCRSAEFLPPSDGPSIIDSLDVFFISSASPFCSPFPPLEKKTGSPISLSLSLSLSTWFSLLLFVNASTLLLSLSA